MNIFFNKSKKTLIITFISIFFLFPSKINASYLDYLDYEIESYDVNIVVNENNVLDITEKINTYFYTSKHGIYRKIPLYNNVIRLDGTTTKNRAKITNIKVSENYSSSLENGNKVLQIGDANNTLIGEKDYTISYSYNLGKDKIDDYDELYFNIIGTEWDTKINNVTFTITMPKEFDETKLGFSRGKNYGDGFSTFIDYIVDGNTITGKLNTTLYKKEGLTIRLELPEGYFVNAKIPINPIDYLMYIIPIIGLILSIFLWKKYGKDDRVIETVEFYPPEGLNSLEIAFIYKGKAKGEDVTSLLIYLANKGYLKINEIEEKTYFGKSKKFEIEKIKEYDGNNKEEKIFFNGLFKKANKVSEASLYDDFYKTQDRILKRINSIKNKKKIFESTSTSKSKFIILSIIISAVAIIIIPLLEYTTITWANVSNILSFLIFSMVFFFSMPMPIKYSIILLGIFLLASLILILEGTSIIYILILTPIYLIGVIFGIICIIGMSICLKLMPKRTKYGNEMLGKIKGFKRFLETAEKNKLESIVLENPTYFYDILPYTYVLGVSSKWISKFESINLQEPDWYKSSSTFEVYTFGKFMNNTMLLAKSSMSSRPLSTSNDTFSKGFFTGSDSSRGGFSGGGFSGGGSGGGGGGSW